MFHNPMIRSFLETFSEPMPLGCGLHKSFSVSFVCLFVFLLIRWDRMVRVG